MLSLRDPFSPFMSQQSSSSSIINMKPNSKQNLEITGKFPESAPDSKRTKFNDTRDKQNAGGAV